MLIFTLLLSIFSASKLSCWRKNCLCLLITSSAYRTPCMVMPLYAQWITSSHHVLHGMVGFDPSVYFQCWDIAWIYSWCEPANWGLLALQHSCLENPMDRGAWWAAVHGVAKSWTRLSHFTFTFHFPALEKEMATHSSVLAWRIPGTVEPSGLPSMVSHRVRHYWSDLAAAAAAAAKTLLNGEN